MNAPLQHPGHAKLVLPLLLLFLFLPTLADHFDLLYYLGFVTRVMIFALAATSLNLVLGFGGMVSFGHAGLFGIGGYAMDILMYYGVVSAWIGWPAAVLASAVAALVIGAISLRTAGAYFIMITLAFAQMLYYVFVSLQVYGGDDGLPLPARSTMPGGLDLNDDATFFYVVTIICVAVLFGFQRLANARFGRVLQAIRENETRMESIGYPVYAYKLAAFIISGSIAGLAGALLANQNNMVSPGMMYWTESGSLMIMVIVGGVGYLYGSVVGAVLLLVFEEILSGLTVHWQLPMGCVLLGVVLLAPNGVASLVRRRVRHA